MTEQDADRSSLADHNAQIVDLEVKLAYQERLIRDLDTLVRGFGDRLDKVDRELRELKHTTDIPLGPQQDKPPHY